MSQVESSSNGGSRSSTHNIPKLNGKNYLSWRDMVEIILQLRGLDEAILSESVDKVKDNTAKLILYETMEESQANIVRGCKSAKAIVDRLEMTYADKSAANVYRMLNDFYGLKKSQDSSMSQHIGRMENARIALAEVGEKQSDAVFMVTLISSLSMSSGYDDLMERWELTHPDMRTIPALVSLILKREQDMKKKGDREGTALITRAASNYKQLTIEERKKVTRCAKCNKKGHWYKECPETDTKKPSAQIVLNLGKLTHELKDSWVADSGATAHMANNESWFVSLTRFDTPQFCSVGDGREVKVIGRGTVKLISNTGGDKYELYLENTMLIPDLTTNLLSIGTAAKSKLATIFGDEGCRIERDGLTIVTGKLIGSKLYVLAVNCSDVTALLMNKKERSYADWHNALGHPGQARLQQLAKNGDIIMSEPQKDEVCADCPAGKAVHASHPLRAERANEVGQRVHVDLAFINKEIMFPYYLLAKDEASEYTLVYFLRTKSESGEFIERLTSDFELMSHAQIRSIRSDNGSEFMNELVSKILLKNQIVTDPSTAYVPQQNGRAERAIGSITRAARTMLIQSSLPIDLAPEAIRTACYLANRLPTKNDPRTPFERFTGKRPTYTHLIPFATPVHVFRNGDYLKKFDSRTSEGFFVGYTSRRNTYRIYLVDQRKVIESCDVYLAPHKPVKVDAAPENVSQLWADVATETLEKSPEDEHEDNLDKQTSTPLGKRTVTGKQLDCFFDDYLWDNEHEGADGQHESDQETNKTFDIHTSQDIVEPRARTKNDQARSEILRSEASAINRSARDRPEASTQAADKTFEIMQDPAQEEVSKLPTQNSGRIFTGQTERGHQVNHSRIPSLINMPFRRSQRLLQSLSNAMPQILLTSVDAEPANFDEATHGPDSQKWSAAIKEELDAHEKNATWQIVDRPSTNVLLTGRWIFKVKRDQSGNVERHKARLVARGYMQRHGLDYFETYAPVAKMASIRLLLALAALDDLKMKQFDVQTAFLHGILEETVFMEPPAGLDLPKDKCLRLKKALYGLKQSPRAWNSALNSALVDIGMHRLNSDPCIYVHTDKKIYLAIYVDDGLVIADQEKDCEKVIEMLNSRFTTKTLSGQIFLGIEITRTESEILLCQSRFIDDMLKRFGLTDGKSALTPLADAKSLLTADTDEEAIDVPYQELIGSLLYCALGTRPDILFATILLSRFNSRPRKCHWTAAKRVLLYLSGTKNLSIAYRKNKNLAREVKLYTDADWGSDPVSRRSVSGCMLILDECLIAYRSKRQTLIAGSTCEAEFISAHDGLKELLWLNKMMSELAIPCRRPTLVVDNAPALKVVRNGDLNQGLKHIDLKYKSVCELYARGAFEIKHTATQNQAADLLTKALPRATMENLNILAGLKTRKATLSVMSGPLLMLIVNVLHAQQPQFKQARWVIWRETEYKVDIGALIINADVIRADYCSAFTTVKAQYKNESEAITNALDRLEQRCKDTDDKYTSRAWARLKEAIQKRQVHRIQKRCFDPISAIGCAAAAALALVSTGTITYFSHPRSPFNTIPQIETAISHLTTKVDKLYNATTAHNDIMSQVEAAIRKIVEKQEQHRVESHKALMTAIDAAWQSCEVHHSIVSTAEAVNIIADEYNKGKLPMRAMGTILNLDSLGEFDAEDTTNWRAEVIDNMTVHFDVNLRLKSEDTAVFEADPFQMVANLTTHPTPLIYAGPSLVIHNNTANCTRGITRPKGRSIYDRCDEYNMGDEKLQNWIRDTNTNLTDLTKISPAVKKTIDGNVVYCLYQNITVKAKSTRCPPWPFLLPATESFNVTGHRHDTHVSTIEATRRDSKFRYKSLNESLVEDLYLSDQMSLIDSVRKKSLDVEKILKSNEERISLPTDVTSLSLICAGAAICWIVTVICCAAFIKRQKIFGGQTEPGRTTNNVHYTAIYNQPEKEHTYYPIRELKFPCAPSPLECLEGPSS